jgi:5-methylcytosine-specific restriction endonuclease McrA
MAAKQDWLEAIASIASNPEYPITNQRLELMSPQFSYGKWILATEHQRGFRNIVLKWRGERLSIPGPRAGWNECPDSDRGKGWSYRIPLEPARLEDLLDLLEQIDSIDPTLDQLHAAFERCVTNSRNDRAEERRARLKNAPKVPQKIKKTVTVYERNADVVAEVLEMADGKCQGCGNSAPFKRLIDQSPYLEVHHKVRLADGGEDTVENAIALCPNCHREKHYG